MQRTISSAVTFTAMLGGPVLVFAGAITAFVHYVWLDAPAEGKLPYVVMMLGVIGAVVWGNFQWLRARRVHMDEQNFYISNYLLDEITVPLADVAGVSQRIMTRGHLLTLHLAVPTKLGTEINFLPPEFSGAKFGFMHPLAEELNALIEANRLLPIPKPPS